MDMHTKLVVCVTLYTFAAIVYLAMGVRIIEAYRPSKPIRNPKTPSL